jgi:uncharacterized protein YdeI (YjbR/CyaY-like superfamily)
VAVSAEGITSPDGLPVVYAAGRGDWRAWLVDNHDRERGAWLVLYKKGTSVPSVSYDEAVEEALAFGWIDSRANRVDDARYLQLITRRKPGSVWSESNKRRVARLIAEGRMTPAGLALVEEAKRNGRWDALVDVQAGVVPDDLAAALAADPGAKAYFDAFPPSSKRIILEWIANAKRPQTRAARIDETVRLAADNLRANHYRQPKGKP